MSDIHYMIFGTLIPICTRVAIKPASDTEVVGTCVTENVTCMKCRVSLGLEGPDYFTAFNETIEQGNQLRLKGQQALKASGFSEFVHSCFEDKDFVDLAAVLRRMDDSSEKGFIKRRMQDEGFNWDIWDGIEEAGDE